ncbi:hypothetical protein ASPCADRAFT_202699 [Aspergillus carbonarius ITEM 5010]|uniref:Uncharacterized protein n=1 Tax=Aspergillus carbonarius (strain ITEM 5010) TaxID=602072 RepID=A0A1R3S287_ASPC5|nr:hypothetical protein ASPCADRAFT_202699 [Aspergillus carbonarius ITEM 5010]
MVPGRQTDSLASTIHGTQADVLPIIVPSPLLRVSKLLAGYHKIEAWERDVSLILRKALLYDLVQKDIPRPDPTHPLFSKWEFFSEMVRAWLYNQLSTSLAAQVRESDYPQDYADDLYVAIRKVVVGHGHNRCKDVWYALADIRRKQYKSTEAFVQGFQDTFMLAKSLNVAPTPYIAFLMLLREVKTDLPHWVEGVEATMWDDVATSFTEQNLLDYCYTAKSEARAGRF